jgi:hypothetical protein
VKLINAMLAHAWLAIRLKHDGTGLPSNIPAALSLVVFYIALSLLNAGISGDIKIGSFLALSFIAQFYVFCLRDKLIGLIILIGVINNILSLLLSVLVGQSEANVVTLALIEFIMIFGAVINVIKSNTKIS